MSPEELVKHAKTKGLSAIAITDHDTIDGVSVAMNEAINSDIEVVAGLEISCDYKPEMHMLGYFFGSTYLNIQDVLKELRENREERNPKIIKKLNELGFNITLDEVKGEAKGQVVGRPHVAKVLLNKGYVKSMNEAFVRFLASGKPAYFQKDKLTPEQGIQEILKAGGVPVLAHPLHLKIGLSKLDTLLGELKTAGLKGVEVYYVDNSSKETGEMLSLAHKHNLVPTGGSDFHGNYKKDIEIGIGYGSLFVPYESLEKLKEAAASE
jgi:predicted metal-dependent phosphoesterase TrpH